MELSKPPGGDVPECKLHWVPFNIDHNGDALVSQYFECNFQEERGITEASFRGRLLRGKPLKVPEGYTGYLVREHRQRFTDAQKRKCTLARRFSDVMYWNLETAPSSDDKARQALQWLKLAEVLHGREGDADAEPLRRSPRRSPRKR